MHFKIEGEVLLNLDIALKKKLVVHQFVCIYGLNFHSTLSLSHCLEHLHIVLRKKLVVPLFLCIYWLNFYSKFSFKGIFKKRQKMSYMKCMSYMQCLSQCYYSKKRVLSCAPVTLILTFIPISAFLQIYLFKENQFMAI